ncbi:MAG: hypothetical protein RIT24_1770 [Planctomycetota bacterium]
MTQNDLLLVLGLTAGITLIIVVVTRVHSGAQSKDHPQTGGFGPGLGADANHQGGGRRNADGSAQGGSSDVFVGDIGGDTGSDGGSDGGGGD